MNSRTCSLATDRRSMKRRPPLLRQTFATLALLGLSFSRTAVADSPTAIVYFVASPANGSFAGNLMSGDTTYGTVYTWHYATLPASIGNGIDRLVVDNPNNLGGNIRTYADPSGGFSARGFDIGDTLSLSKIGVPGEGGTVIATLVSTQTIFAPAPVSNDTVRFGYLGPDGPRPVGPPEHPVLPGGREAYTVALGSHTVAETDAGFFGQSKAAGITFQVDGSYVSKFITKLEGQKIVLQGSGTFTTGALTVAGNVTVSSSTLHSDTALVDTDEDHLDHPPSTTTLLLDGATAKLEVRDFIEIGQSDDSISTLSLKNGATGKVGSIFLGTGSSEAHGALLIDHAALVSTSFLDVGLHEHCDGMVTISHGGQLTDTNAAIGLEEGAEGHVTVTGRGSLWTNKGFVVVGYRGKDQAGDLKVESGGKVTTQSYLALGGNVDGHLAGSGSMTIRRGGIVISGTGGGGPTLAAAVGFGPNSDGTVQITGQGSLWEIKSRLVLGYSSESMGDILVENGGRLQVDGDLIRLGRVAGSSGSIIFDRKDRLNPVFDFAGNNMGQLLVGDAGTGNFFVRGGAAIKVGADVVVGNLTGSTGTLTVDALDDDDSKSTVATSLQAGGDLVVGKAGKGTLNVQNGATMTMVAQSTLTLGAQLNSTGEMNVGPGVTEVAGVSTIFRTSGVAVIGDAGAGTLELGPNARVYTGRTVVGQQTGGLGKVSMGGLAPSLWQVEGDLTIGSAGEGTVLGGDSSTIRVSGKIVIGELASSVESSLTMDKARPKSGTGHLQADEITVGLAGKGQLEVRVGNDLTARQLILGDHADSFGSAIFQQASMTLRDLTVGDSGRGFFNFQGKNTLLVSGATDVAAQAHSTGELLAAGTGLTLASLNLGGTATHGGGEGALHVGNNAAVRVASTTDLWDDGSIDVTYFATAGQGGSLLIGDFRKTLAAGTVTVGTGGVLEGSGRIVGKVLNDGGFVSPGHSPGTLNISGDFVQTAKGTLKLEVAGTSAGQFDILKVSGQLTLGGALELDFINGFAPHTGDVFGLLNFGALAGQFARVNVTGLAPGWQFTLDPAASSLSLTSASNAVFSPDFLVPAGSHTALAGVGSGQIVRFLGGTLVDTRGVPLGNAVTLEAGGGTFQNAAGMSSTLSGVISGTGSFTKAGEGALTVSGASTYTGDTRIVDGTLFVDGSLASPRVTVGPRGLLGGYGTLLGSVLNLGTVSPGHSPGALHIGGDFTQGSSGVLRIEIGGLGSARHDLLAIGSAAHLGGTLELVRRHDFTLSRGETVTFLTAAGGVDGRFASVANSFETGTILEAAVVYAAHSVSLEAQQGSFGEFARRAGLTENQRAVARGLDAVAFNPRADRLINYLDGRQLEKLPRDFDRVAPEELTSIFTSSVALANVQGLNLQRRTDELRGGASGFSASGLSLHGHGPGYSGSLGPVGEEQEGKMISSGAPDPRWGAFLSGTGEWVSVGDTSQARGYDLTSGGFTLGVDCKVTPQFALGVSAGYTGTSAALADGGRLLVNGGKLGLYATYFTGGFYADASVQGGYNDYDTKRRALRSDARGDLDGGELSTLLGLGYDWKSGGWSLGPTGTFGYTYIGLGGFQEHGSLAPLRLSGDEAHSLRSALGVKSSYDWKLGALSLRPEVRAAWQHEYGDTGYSLDATLAHGDGAFSVSGPHFGRDSALLSAGITLQLGARFSTYLSYDGEIGREHYAAHSVSGGLGVTF